MPQTFENWLMSVVFSQIPWHERKNMDCNYPFNFHSSGRFPFLQAYFTVVNYKQT